MGKRSRTKRAPRTQPAQNQPWWRSPVLWLGSTGTAVLLLLVGSLVDRFDKPDLRVAEEVTFVLSMPAREIRDGVERQLLSAVVCVQNRGFRTGALERAVISPVGLPRVPDLEVIRLDQDPIVWRDARPVEVIVALKAPFTISDTTPIGFRLDLYDATNNYVDDINVLGKFTPSQPGAASRAPRTLVRPVPQTCAIA